MRRHVRGDRGAVLPFVAVMLVVLVGMGALVVDAGALYQERRELQNGADAAALAVAKDCAEGDCDDGPWGPPAESTAKHFANENAEDDLSEIDEICGDGPGLVACGETPEVPDGATGWVKVTTETSDEINDQIDFVLAPVLDAALDGKTVHATAIAAWGPVGSATTIPLIFSLCEFTEFGGSLDPVTLPDGSHHIYFHHTEPAGDCPQGPAGDDLPGGFGWLDATDCEITIDQDGWVRTDTGVAFDNDCKPETWQNAEVLIPLFDQTNELTGNNIEYHVAGFIGFKVLGYKFPARTWPTGFECPLQPGGSGTCLYGEFTEITTTGDGFGEHDFGARIIKMIG